MILDIVKHFGKVSYGHKRGRGEGGHDSYIFLLDMYIEGSV